MAVRAVCADAGEDMPELAQKETRCAKAAWLGVGALESWRRIKKGGSVCTCVMTWRGSVQRVQGLVGATVLGIARVFWRSRRRRVGETECIPAHGTCLISGLSGVCPVAGSISVEQQ
jgi:hypothetical protein